MQKTAILVVVLFSAFLAGCTIPPLPDFLRAHPEQYHTHADIKVVINGDIFDFNKAQYMSYTGHELSHDTHMHDFNPHVVHFHNPASTLGDFFKSIGMSLDDRCLDIGKEKLCSNGTRNLYVYVNDIPLFLNYSSYIPKDLDRILIYYGDGAPTRDQIESITREACIYSKRCLPPPGFVIGEESCSGTEPCRL